MGTLKRVIILSGKLGLSGSTTWMLNLSSGFEALGLQVIHLVLGEPGTIKPGVPAYYTGKVRSDLKLRLLRLLRTERFFPHFFRALENQAFAQRAEWILAEAGVHTDNGDTLFITDFTSRLPQRLAQWPVISVIHQPLSVLPEEKLRRYREQPCRWRVAVSAVTAEDAATAGVNVDAVIHNPLDIRRIRQLSQQPVPVLPHIHNAIVFVGRLLEEKGVLTLLGAFASLPDTFLHLYFIGEGGAISRLREEAGSRGVADRVHFPGYQNNPYPYIRQSRLLVLPSYFEAMAYTPLEAVALGVPFVVTGYASASQFFLPEAIVPLEPQTTLVQRMADRIHQVLARSVEPSSLVLPGIMDALDPAGVAQRYLDVYNG